jgi:hypothetical protein
MSDSIKKTLYLPDHELETIQELICEATDDPEHLEDSPGPQTLASTRPTASSALTLSRANSKQPPRFWSGRSMSETTSKIGSESWASA